MNDNNRTILFFPFFFLAFLFCLFPSRLVYYNYVAVCLCLACVSSSSSFPRSLQSASWMDPAHSGMNILAAAALLVVLTSCMPLAFRCSPGFQLASTSSFGSGSILTALAATQTACTYLERKVKRPLVCSFVFQLAGWLAVNPLARYVAGGCLLLVQRTLGRRSFKKLEEHRLLRYILQASKNKPACIRAHLPTYLPTYTLLFLSLRVYAPKLELLQPQQVELGKITNCYVFKY